MTSKINPQAETAPVTAKKRRKVPLWLWIAALAVAGFFGWEWWASSREVGTDNAYVKADRVLIAPQVGGRVVAVGVGQNQAVKRGDLLFRIDPEPLQIALAQAQAQLARIDNSANASRAQVREAGTSISAADENLQWARRDFARMSELAAKQLVARKMLDDARHAVAEAQVQRESAIATQSQASAVLGGSAATPTSRLPEYRAALAAVQKATLDLAHAEVRAPVDGIVGMHDLQVGEYINIGQTAMPLVAGAPIWIEANFKETDLAKMRIGQAARITVDSYPGAEWSAHVASISPTSGAEFSVLPPQNATGNWVKIVQRIPVRIEIDHAEADAPQLRAGMSAEVEVDLREGGASANRATAAR
jgi:membrane fusion protein, multidrug efflux system